MLPTRLIIAIEQTLMHPNKRILIMHPHRYGLDRIRGEDMGRIALPGRKIKDDRREFALENRSLVKFSLTDETALRALTYDLAILADLSDRDKERFMPMVTPLTRDGQVEVVDTLW